MASPEKFDREAPPVPPRAAGADGPPAAASVTSTQPPAQPPTQAANERFDDILVRLRGVVEKLEGGNLSLEDSLTFFEEGISLCRRGATILDSAERKVEVLLGGSGRPAGSDGGRTSAAGGDARTAPFDVPSGDED